MPGSFFWYDVMTTDTAAAGRFYSDVVGWGVQDANSPTMPYTLFTVQGRGVAGLMPVPDDMKGEAQPVWMAYIEVDDVDAAVAKIAGLGGAIHRAPVVVPGVIEFAVVADPQGAVFLVAKALNTEPMEPLPPQGVGMAGWHELYAGDWETVFPFYETMFGWTRAELMDMGAMGSYQLFATGGPPVGGMMTKPAALPRPFWSIYFIVEAMDSAIERIKAGGGQIVHGPMEVPGGAWIVQGRDPQGAHFALTAAKR